MKTKTIHEVQAPIPQSVEEKNEAYLVAHPSESRASMMKRAAIISVDPVVNGAILVKKFDDYAQDEAEVFGALLDGAASLRAGNMGRAEDMLFGQAHALEKIFVHMACRARDASISHAEQLMRMALKAQNQCRMTLDTLATLKNPPLVIGKQTNIANGPQQVNNGVGIDADGRPKENSGFVRNELLEASDGERMDAGTTISTGRVDSHMEAVGANQRTPHA